MKKTIITSMYFICLLFFTSIGYAQSSNKTDSVNIEAVTDSVFATIEKAVFSRSEELFFIGIDKGSLAFNYENIEAIQNTSAKYVEILNIKMNDRKLVLNELKNEAFYYTNYNLTFRVNHFTFQVNDVRETGVVKLNGNQWEIIQQHASVPVTNDLWPAYLAKEQQNSAPSAKYEVDKLKEDYDLFSLALEEAHAGLHNYTSEKEYKTLTQSIKNELTHPMSDLDFYRLLCPIIEIIKCGHTKISVSDETYEFINTQKNFIPLQLKFIDDKVYVSNNLGSNEIAPGAEILSINDKPMAEIIAEIFKNQNSDCAITTAKYRKLDERFHELYSMFIEQTESLTIKYIPYQENQTREVTLTGISNHMWWEKVNSARPPAPNLMDFKIVENSDIAVLEIRKFVSQEINAQYGPFQKYMDSVFTIIKDKEVKNLIVDLRDNGGGDISAELLPYLVNHPIQYYKTIDALRTCYSFLEHTDKGPFFNKIHVNLWNKFRNDKGRYELTGNRNEYIIPGPFVYNGDIYVLINGNSFSATSELASILQDQKRATFFGEETGGSKLGSSSGDFINLTLPNTRIKVTIPIRNYTLKLSQDNNDAGGVKPDYKISNSIDNILEGTDGEMKFVIDYVTMRQSD